MKDMNGKTSKLPYINWNDYKKPEDEETLSVLELQLENCRSAYTQGLNAMMEAIADEFYDEDMAQYPVQDMAMFGVFLGSIKMVELAGQPMERRQLLSAFNFLMKRCEREIVEMLLAFLKSIEAERAEN